MLIGFHTQKSQSKSLRRCRKWQKINQNHQKTRKRKNSLIRHFGFDWISESSRRFIIWKANWSFFLLSIVIDDTLWILAEKEVFSVLRDWCHRLEVSECQTSAKQLSALRIWIKVSRFVVRLLHDWKQNWFPTYLRSLRHSWRFSHLKFLVRCARSSPLASLSL